LKHDLATFGVPYRGNRFSADLVLFCGVGLQEILIYTPKYESSQIKTDRKQLIEHGGPLFINIYSILNVGQILTENQQFENQVYNEHNQICQYIGC